MEPGEQLSALRKAILSVYPVEDLALNRLINIFNYKLLKPDEYFAKGGEYSSHFAFAQKGILKSYYLDQKGNQLVKGIFVDHMFVLPLPSFLYRKPSYLNFQAIIQTELLQADYIRLESLVQHHPSVRKFVNKLIENEWIISRELHEAGLHIYNSSTRFQIFTARYGLFLELIAAEDIASFLGITVKQFNKYKVEYKTDGVSGNL